MVNNGMIWQGVLLLCNIGKGYEAACVLQQYNKWVDAAWLAKVCIHE